MRSLLLLLSLAACAHSVRIPIEPGMGQVDRPIRTASAEARRHFEAGLALAYGFNYDEAIYEFVVALHADPACAMCAWGLAYASGPNINDPFRQTLGAPDAAARAVSLAQGNELALARAITARFGPAPTTDLEARQKLDQAYAAAMRTAAAAAPNDDDIQTLYAEALMQDTPPFVRLWAKDGKPDQPHAVEARAVLERVLARSPNHIGAIHFYIHLVDGGPHMNLAIPYAERLGTLAPNAGHLVHMPSHLFLKVGRYADADDVNVKAMAVDREHLARVAPGSAYAMFTMHPQHYLWYVLLFEGAKARSVDMVKTLLALVNKPGMDMGMAQEAGMFMALTTARFGMWDEALALPPAEGQSPAAITTAFARGLALVAKNRLDEAEKQIEIIRTASTMPEMPPMPPPADPAAHDHGAAPMPMGPPGPPPIFMEFRRRMLEATGAAVIAQLEGVIAEARSDHAKAIESLRRAAELEAKLDDLGELSMLPVPARQRLGALLLAAGDAAGAETVYRADLVVWPENGWSLFGLATALDKQGKPEAKAMWSRFTTAWKRSDIKLTRSAY